MSDTDIRAQLEEERRIIDAAYPGPWEVGAYSESTNSNFFGAVQDSEDPSEPGPLLGDAHLPDAAFITHARTALPVRNAQIEAVLERAESWELQATCEGTINPVWAEAIKHCAAEIRRTIEEAGK